MADGPARDFPPYGAAELAAFDPSTGLSREDWAFVKLLTAAVTDQAATVDRRVLYRELIAEHIALADVHKPPLEALITAARAWLTPVDQPVGMARSALDYELGLFWRSVAFAAVEKLRVAP